MAVSKNKHIIQVPMPVELWEKVRDYAKSNGISAAAAINLFVSQQIRSIEMTGTMAKAVRELSDEQLQELLKSGLGDIRDWNKV